MRTAADLGAALDRARDGGRPGRGVLATLFSPAGSHLSVGLGGGTSVLTYADGPDPPYFLSRGTDAPAGDGPLVFYYEGHYSDFPPTAAVPADLARRAALEFFRTGERPTCVDWEDT